MSPGDIALAPMGVAWQPDRPELRPYVGQLTSQASTVKWVPESPPHGVGMKGLRDGPGHVVGRRRSPSPSLPSMSGSSRSRMSERGRARTHPSHSRREADLGMPVPSPGLARWPWPRCRRWQNRAGEVWGQGSEGTEDGNPEVQSAGLRGDALHSEQVEGIGQPRPAPSPSRAAAPTYAGGKNPGPASCPGTERSRWMVLRP